MNWKHYKELMLYDAQDWIDENYIYYDVEEWELAFNEMELCITGNDNGSRTCDAWQAEQDVKDVIWDNEFQEFITGCMGASMDCVMKDPETADVYACIAALDSVYYDVQNYWEEKFVKEE